MLMTPELYKTSTNGTIATVTLIGPVALLAASKFGLRTHRTPPSMFAGKSHGTVLM